MSRALPPKIREFISLAGARSINDNNAIFFHNLVRAKVGKDPDIVSYTVSNPEIITYRFGQHSVFDYFYDKVVKIPSSLPTYNFWMNSLFKIIDIVVSDAQNDDEEARYIKLDPKYIKLLQSGMKNHTLLFARLVESEFEISDCLSLCYSVICRGELDKLKILNRFYPIEQFPGLFSHALRYGRFEILTYLIDELKLDPRNELYGDVINLEHYQDNKNNLYYSSALESLAFSKSNPKISMSQQNYRKSFDLVIAKTDQNVTIETIELWKDRVERTVYDWDKISFSEIVEILRPLLKNKIPLTHDFGEKYNRIVFGEKWSDRKFIIEYCLQLENKIHDLETLNNELRRRISHGDSESGMKDWI